MEIGLRLKCELFTVESQAKSPECNSGIRMRCSNLNNTLCDNIYYGMFKSFEICTVNRDDFGQRGAFEKELKKS